MRLFIAINFDDYVKNKLLHVQQQLKKHSLKGTFTAKENFHLTLAFLGEMSLEQINEIKEIIDNSNFTSFILEFAGIGKFKSRDGDIYWMGVEDNNKLNQLQNSLAQRLKKNGYRIDEKPFLPHITLGRRIVMETSSQNYMNIIVPSIRVDHISLMKSERIENILTYTQIHRYEAI